MGSGVVHPRLGPWSLGYLSVARRFRGLTARLEPFSPISESILGQCGNEARFRLRSGMSATYRSYKPGDAHGVARIHFENFAPLRPGLGEGEWKRQIQEVYSEENMFWLTKIREYRIAAAEGGCVLGLVSWKRYSQTRAEIISLSVDQRFHGKGVGKLLASLSLLEAIEAGIKSVSVYAAPMSQRIFAALGFREASPILGWLTAGTALSLRVKTDAGAAISAFDMLESVLEPAAAVKEGLA